MHTMKRITILRTLALLATVWALAGAATAAPTQELATVSCAGGWIANGTMRMAVCAGSLGGPVSHGGNQTHYGGFIGASFIQPGTLSANGVPVEADPDNDGDGLEDGSEVDGTAFDGYAVTDPNRADTDGDGMSDDAEARGMYDPTDPGHLLRIIAFDTGNGTNSLTWIGRAGLNRVYAGEELLSGAPTQLLHEAAFGGGTPPWYKTTNSHSWAAGASPNRVYQVETER